MADIAASVALSELRPMLRSVAAPACAQQGLALSNNKGAWLLLFSRLILTRNSQFPRVDRY